MQDVSDVTAKDMMSPDPIVLHAEHAISRAVREMALANIRHLPVVDDQGLLVGIVSQRDLLSPREGARRIADIMRTDVKTVAPDTAAHEAAYLLLRYKIGSLPVTDAAGKLVGIVTESDFVRLAHTLLGGRVSADQLELEESEANRV